MKQIYQTHQKTQEKPQSIAVFLKQSPRSIQLVFKYLLNFANCAIFPSHETIAKATGYHYNTVRSALNKLRDAGILSWKQRWNTSCLYYLSEIILNPATLSWLKSYYLGFMAIALLAPYYSYSLGDCQLRGLKDLYLSKKEVREASHEDASSFVASYHLMRYVPTLQKNEPYSQEQGEPNTKMSYVAFEATFLKEKEHTMNKSALLFNEQQLLELAQFSKEAIADAHKALTRMLSQGRHIDNQFTFFKACAAKYEREHPKKGTSGFANKEQPKEYQPKKEWQPDAHREELVAQSWRMTREQAEAKLALGLKGCDRLPPALRLQHREKAESLFWSLYEKYNPPISKESPILKSTDTQSTLFDVDTPNNLDYDQLDEILD